MLQISTAPEFLKKYGESGARNLYRFVVYHSSDFASEMDLLFGPLWRGWPFKRVRAHAKAWVHGYNYGLERFV